MCERNGTTFKSSWPVFEINIECDPNIMPQQWLALASSKRGGGYHYCHAWIAHPLDHEWACDLAAEQINENVNKLDKLDNWTLILAKTWVNRGY
ncbi:hypothetical protein A3A66_01760 [Microgenomates group bacterium RIFCSPLOWO2_01_FULL_46_13]|nr:MAG: hypothetical protein A3A66_01760 [Microgenomates group bacterium RIFCSPLOWO2_01_FULL_46_13]